MNKKDEFDAPSSSKKAKMGNVPGSSNDGNLLTGTIPCGGKRRHTCEHTLQTSVVKGSKGSQEINQRFDCHSECIIYAIICAKCKLVYIGETEKKLHERFRRHLNNLKQDKCNGQVVEHFTSVHSKEDMQVTVLEYAPKNKHERQELEASLIAKLGTRIPYGLNTK